MTRMALQLVTRVKMMMGDGALLAGIGIAPRAILKRTVDVGVSAKPLPRRRCG